MDYRAWTPRAKRRAGLRLENETKDLPRLDQQGLAADADVLTAHPRGLAGRASRLVVEVTLRNSFLIQHSANGVEHGVAHRQLVCRTPARLPTPSAPRCRWARAVKFSKVLKPCGAGCAAAVEFAPVSITHGKAKG